MGYLRDYLAIQWSTRFFSILGRIGLTMYSSPAAAGEFTFQRHALGTRLAGNGYFCVTTMVICRPSILGSCSTLLISSRSSRTRINTFMPRS
jgi:hypothetical protein